MYNTRDESREQQERPNMYNNAADKPIADGQNVYNDHEIAIKELSSVIDAFERKLSKVLLANNDSLQKENAATLTPSTIMYQSQLKNWVSDCTSHVDISVGRINNILSRLDID